MQEIYEIFPVELMSPQLRLGSSAAAAVSCSDVRGRQSDKLLMNESALRQVKLYHRCQRR